MTPKFTYLLLVLVVNTLGPSLVGRIYSLSSASGATQTSSKGDSFQEAKQHFPTAEYEEQDLSDLGKETQKRHNNFKLVAKNPQPWQTESVFIPERNFNFPALPVSTSQLIVVGRVTEATAHLSENKLNVYSEFLLVLSSVLKTPTKEITENSRLTVERLGGNVRYPNGQKILFRISGWNMPKAGSEYLFFLNCRNKIDWEIVTAYELTENGVLALDQSSQFEALSGKPAIEIFKQIRALISEQSSR